LYHEYARGRQTLAFLEQKTGKTKRTLQKHFNQLSPYTGEIFVPLEPVALLMDATFFSRRDGLLIARKHGKNLLWQRIETESVSEYEKLLNNLQNAGVQFSSFTIDGRTGVLRFLLRKYQGIPVQLCQFHQVQIMTRYLTKRPKTDAGKTLRALTLTLPSSSGVDFTARLEKWYEQSKSFLDEKTLSNDKKRGWHYTHRRIRSAVRSLRRNLPYLFTFEGFPDRNIPKTTNSCDGFFSHLKSWLNVHRGLRDDRKWKMLHYLLENN